MLTQSQEKALKTLKSQKNVFLSGNAGTGKSYLIDQFLKSNKDVDVLATTGAAAILIGGRTIHSFFGLYRFDSVEAMVECGMKPWVRNRIKDTNVIIIDEISMLTPEVFQACEKIARQCKRSEAPWGGIRVIAVGDFFQLPPVDTERKGGDVNWVFDTSTWKRTNFVHENLTETVRTQDPEFLKVLDLVRVGQLDGEVKEFLNSRKGMPNRPHTKLVGRRAIVDKLNREALERLDGEYLRFETTYSGEEKDVQKVKRNAPFSKEIVLKKDAFVMIRQNDPDGYPYRYANGSCGHFRKMVGGNMKIELLDGNDVFIAKRRYEHLNGDGEVVATATNFPVNVAYAQTIHKAQGATLDCVHTDLGFLWEPGQAYVALSRVRKAEDLFISDWSKEAVFADDRVVSFFLPDSMHIQQNTKAGIVQS